MSKSKTENLISIQPYFVMESDDFCQTILVKNGISHFFSFSNKSGEDITVPLFVDGCSNLIFEYKDNSVRTHFVGSTIETRTFSVKKNAEYFSKMDLNNLYCLDLNKQKKEIKEQLPYIKQFVANNTNATKNKI